MLPDFVSSDESGRLEEESDEPVLSAELELAGVLGLLEEEPEEQPGIQVKIRNSISKTVSALFITMSLISPEI